MKWLSIARFLCIMWGANGLQLGQKTTFFASNCSKTTLVRPGILTLEYSPLASLNYLYACLSDLP
jgi:hypothetical protein